MNSFWLILEVLSRQIAFPTTIGLTYFQAIKDKEYATILLKKEIRKQFIYLNLQNHIIKLLYKPIGEENT